MRKIPSLFMRNYDTDRLVRDEVVPGCEWVTRGEGVPTRKWDGTACMVLCGRLYRRLALKPGRNLPVGFIPASRRHQRTGKQFGWVPVGPGPEDQWHREAYDGQGGHPLEDGTYELCGPKVQGNPEELASHYLIRHGTDIVQGNPRDFGAIREFLSVARFEGIVWHHPDGRMAKIKARDFGIRRYNSPGKKANGEDSR